MVRGNVRFELSGESPRETLTDVLEQLGRLGIDVNLSYPQDQVSPSIAIELIKNNTEMPDMSVTEDSIGQFLQSEGRTEGVSSTMSVSLMRVLFGHVIENHVEYKEVSRNRYYYINRPDYCECPLRSVNVTRGKRIHYKGIDPLSWVSFTKLSKSDQSKAVKGLGDKSVLLMERIAKTIEVDLARQDSHEEN